MSINLLAATGNQSLIWIGIVIIAILSVSIAFTLLFFMGKAKTEIQQLAETEKGECKYDPEAGCECKRDGECTCEGFCHCHPEDKAEEAADSVIDEDNVPELRYDEVSATRPILIDMLKQAGVTGISRLKKQELVDKVKELGLEYPVIIDIKY